MNLGFDLDGVVCDIDHWKLKAMDSLNDSTLPYWYYAYRRVKLNPAMFKAPNDRAYIITSRSSRFRDITISWLRKHGVAYDDIIFLNIPHRTLFATLDEWYTEIANRKASIIEKLKIDVYFEDELDVISKLRNKCKAKIIRVV